ncbi:hypothetical protein ACTZIZ_05015 [Escherichia coli]|nr:hypothetical protein [Escherichia coli]EHJ6793245.1 hypothetical protein [Escherichia coli]EHK1626656.1 hypothetical protein [Escherichia coli]EHN2786745.1 hypothetical protein [Escherichia coli]EHO2027843.1 hypothetical protein [Escherichia coli]EHP5234988.1 hypothetical protein [Escherichia coli]
MKRNDKILHNRGLN